MASHLGYFPREFILLGQKYDKLRNWNCSGPPCCLKAIANVFFLRLHEIRIRRIAAVCLQCGGNWYTPKEFVQVAGKSTLKDWKRAIRINGQMLRYAILRRHFRPPAAEHAAVQSRC